MGDKLFQMRILITILIAIMMVIMFTLFPIGGSSTARFDVFVPEDYGLERLYNNPESNLTISHTDYRLVHKDGTMSLGPYSNAAGWWLLKDYRGYHIKFEATYSHLDDENWYCRSIHNINIQEDEDLGSYPKGFHHHDYYHKDKRWWED